MSDNARFGWLRLYPAHFRRQYGEEMRLLIRDRIRDEAGALNRMRLCLDLSLDMALTLPRLYLGGHGAEEALEDSPGSGPQFRLLDRGRPSLPVMLASATLSWLLMHVVRQLGPCPGFSAASLIPLLLRTHGLALHG